MSYLVVCGVALFAAGLTLYSGFGLGTLLLPAFAIFFPLELAVAATAVVHLANNLFKLALVGRDANLDVVVRFAVPGAAGALAGAWALAGLAGMAPLANWSLGARVFEITPIKLVLGVLIAGFALLEISKRAEALRLGRRCSRPAWSSGAGSTLRRGRTIRSACRWIASPTDRSWSGRTPWCCGPS